MIWMREASSGLGPSQILLGNGDVLILFDEEGTFQMLQGGKMSKIESEPLVESLKNLMADIFTMSTPGS